MKPKLFNRYIYLIPVVFFGFEWSAVAQPSKGDRFTWGNATYINLSVGETVNYGSSEIELLEIRNHFNLIRVDHDTIRLKVSYRSPAKAAGNLMIFVADNRNELLWMAVRPFTA